MAAALTPDAIPMICSGAIKSEDEVNPVVQILDIKALNSNSTGEIKERYRMSVSDGKHTQPGMLATQLNPLVGHLHRGTIIKLKQFVSQTIQNRVIIIIIDLDIILENCDQIGDPKPYVHVQGAAASGPAPQISPSISVAPSMDQSRLVTENPQSYGGGSAASGSVSGRTGNGRDQLHHPVVLNPQPFSSNLGSRDYPAMSGPPAHPRSKYIGGGLATAPSSGVSRADGGSRAPSTNRQQQSTFQQSNSMNRAPPSRTETSCRLLPISALNPYQGHWAIQARVTSKSDTRKFSNSRNQDGKVFSFDVLDKDGGEIQVTCFNTAVDQFFHRIEVGKMYYISQGTLKPAQKNFCRVDHNYTIFLENNSVVDSLEDDNSVPLQKFKFCKISDIETRENKAIVDVIGVVSSIYPAVEVHLKDGSGNAVKQSLQLKDQSGRSVEITLWGNFCGEEGHQLQGLCDSGGFPVVAIKSCKVSDFSGRSLGTMTTSKFFINPDFKEALELKEWFITGGQNAPSVSISTSTGMVVKTNVRKNIFQIKDENLGVEKVDWIAVKGTVSFLKADTFFYRACPVQSGTRMCSKKAIDQGDGSFRCDLGHMSQDPDYRYILQLQIQDHTGVTWATAFQEGGEQIMGKPAKDLFASTDGDVSEFRYAIRDVLFSQFLFTLKVHTETFQDEQRVKTTVVKAEKLNVISEAMYLLDHMDKGADAPNALHGMNRNPQIKLETPMKMASNVRASQAGQYGNQHNSARAPAATDTGVAVYCKSCGGRGHNEQHCPSNRNIQGQPMGHGYANSAPSGGANSGGAKCYRCQQPGHFANACPGSNNASVYQSGGGGFNGGYGGVSNQGY